MQIIINKEYIESHLGKKITQSQANHIISKVSDNDGLWDILHESIDNASETMQPIYRGNRGYSIAEWEFRNYTESEANNG